ncbi:sigma factor-like helix-turn-helix DNA-binding protein [Actinokineospora auranticolor]|uniref:RNA polymerase sigma factor (Sigma-70 family) n=1 Tax=Actinokineospora auranticolor TaxID=155976 RepID=A0A2S6H0H1_9PSEU|nr:sigma factor-like helix-turn-helix DNA-binding protein [Actinokineospora auranticolor]PPK70900.1 RNA polymerase sigma factor (sigma-70 family) [Actinokineospora auranticolor]
MSTLSPLQRHVLRLRVVDGRTAEEVAVELSMSPQAVRVTQHRALEALRAHLKRRRRDAEDDSVE